MSTMGTFDAFTTARLGIYAAQHGLRVTGNNVSNINTEGYTRQRLDQVSFKAGAYDMYRSQLDNHVGSGALVMSINQVRDPYLDVRFRNTSAEVGYNDTMLSGLQRIADILDEVGKGEDASSNEEGDGILHAQILKLSDALRAYEAEPTDLNDTLVRNAAENLCYLFNKYGDKLESLYQETVEGFNSKVTAVNECLTNIRDLNREIRDSEIYGDNSLELRDERNRQIDKLAEYIHIKVVYSEEDIGCGQKVEKLSILLDDDNPDRSMHTDESVLVDGVFGAQLYQPTTMPMLNPNYKTADDPLYLVELKAGDTDPFTGKKVAADTTIGTNDPTLATQVRNNDYFGLQIGKLYDMNNQEWTSSSSTREPVDKAMLAKLAEEPVNTKNNEGWILAAKAEPAVFRFKLTASAADTWDGVTGIELSNGTTLAIGTDIAAADMQDPAKLAAAVAAKFTGPTPDGYLVTADGDNLVYTAVDPGRVGRSGPKGSAQISFVAGDPDTGAKITVEAGESSPGKEAVFTPPQPNPQDPVPNPLTGADSITSYQQINGVWYEVTTIVEHTREVALDDNDLYGSLQATRELLTEAGEFTTQDVRDNIDENSVGKRGIPYYINSLDLLAREFAKQYNTINQGYQLNEKGNYTDKDYQEITLRDEDKGEDLPVSKYNGLTEGQKKTLLKNAAYVVTDADGNKTVDLDKWLKDNQAVPMGGVLFSNRNDNDDPTGITAKNISISQSWSNGSKKLIPRFEVLFGGSMDHSSQNINARNMVSTIAKGLVYDPRDIEPNAAGITLFTGSFTDMFNNINGALGKDIRSANIGLNTSYSSLIEIDTQRDGVSGVDLNDEAMNMMQFQKAMNAAMRVMTAIDEALDRLINNTGIAGR